MALTFQSIQTVDGIIAAKSAKRSIFSQFESASLFSKFSLPVMKFSQGNSHGCDSDCLQCFDTVRYRLFAYGQAEWLRHCHSKSKNPLSFASLKPRMGLPFFLVLAYSGCSGKEALNGCFSLVGDPYNGYHSVLT